MKGNDATINNNCHDIKNYSYKKSNGLPMAVLISQHNHLISQHNHLISQHNHLIRNGQPLYCTDTIHGHIQVSECKLPYSGLFSKQKFSHKKQNLNFERF